MVAKKEKKAKAEKGKLAHQMGGSFDLNGKPLRMETPKAKKTKSTKSTR